MSTAIAQDFITKVKSDAEIMGELKGVRTSSTQDALDDAVAIASKHGFKISAADLEKAISYEVSPENVQRFVSADGSKTY